MSLPTATNLLCSTLVGAVLLCGVHAKDIVSLTLQVQFTALKAASHDDNGHRISVELHNHVDKAGKSLIKVAVDDPQADQRSLRRNHIKKQARGGNKYKTPLFIWQHAFSW